MIVIGGSARSGTTIIGKIINSLDKTEYMFEPPMIESILLKEDELKKESLKELLQFYFFDNFLLDALAGRNINLNKNDDSSILHVKDEEDINNRHQRSLTRIELEKLVLSTNFSFKLPEVVFFLDTLDELFPQNRKILMHRNPNDVINSIVKKKWFSDEYLNINHFSQMYAVEILDNIKVPYWIKETDKQFWVNATELNRCAYYYKRISEEILKNADRSIIIDYDEFIQKPADTIQYVVDKLGLKYGVKTQNILDTVKYQEKNRENYLSEIEETLLLKIKDLDFQIRGLINV